MSDAVCTSSPLFRLPLLPIAMSQRSETFSLVIPDDQVEERLKDKQEPENTDGKRGSKIQRVPPLLRDMEKNRSCYNPRVVSLGPYHHGSDELQALEKLKPQIALQYVERVQRKGEELYASVAKVSKEARKCYAEGSTEMFDDEAFTWMMFLDACFVLQFLREHENPMLTSHVAALVWRDLFLLENQIPLLVLKALFHCGYDRENEWSSLIYNFLESIHPLTASRKKSPSKMPSDPVHLLEILWNGLVGDVVGYKAHKRSYAHKRNWFSHVSANELKGRGIYLKCSKYYHFTDISFFSMFGVGFLHLPQIIINDTTQSMLLNLVAYESCPGHDKKSWVSSYICFMNVLIRQAEDVKELRSKEILLNSLGSDQQVVELFKEMADGLTPNPNDYLRVRMQMASHYRNRFKTWTFEWLHTHFNNPNWTVPALLGALLALFLSAVQTYYQVLKS